MFICVDGTGPSDSSRYRELFSRSFINQIKNTTTHQTPGPIYHRGPGNEVLDGVVGTFGGRNHVAPSFVFGEIMNRRNTLGGQISAITMPFGPRTAYRMTDVEQEQVQVLQNQRKIFLAGYSRGGAIIIHVARLLGLRGIPVEAMFLFDAVSRNMDLDAETIPDNVGVCYHAIRSSTARSRESFGNCGLGPAALVCSERFMTTHGGMGGVPWGVGGLEQARPTRTGTILAPSPFINEGGVDGLTAVTPSQEASGMEQGRVWMWSHLRRHGVIRPG